VEDCSRSWRRKLEKPVFRRWKGWTAGQQVGWRKQTGVVSAGMARQWHGEVWRQIRWCTAQSLVTITAILNRMHQQRVGRCESRGYWICCWRVASASAHLRSCWMRTFHAIILSRHCNKDDVIWRVTFWETITASHVCRYSVTHSVTLKYCVDGSIWHFEFPKVVQAHTLG